MYIYVYIYVYIHIHIYTYDVYIYIYTYVCTTYMHISSGVSGSSTFAIFHHIDQLRKKHRVRLRPLLARCADSPQPAVPGNHGNKGTS